MLVPVSALVPAVMLVAAALVYGAASGFVYSEYSDFATQFGNHPWYSPLGLGDILGKYFSMSQGWYRPTSFYLIPYLLRLDYFEPGGVVAVNVAFFVLAASSVVLLVRRAPFAAALYAAVFVLFAPTLYLVTYGVQIDSLYIIFSVAFLALMIRLQRPAAPRLRHALRAAAVVTFALALTSKEIAVVLSFVLVSALLLTGPALTRERIVAALRTASPFILVSVAFVVLYKLGRPVSGGVYDTSPSLDKLPSAVSLTTWTFGFRSPVHAWAHWIPPWGTGEKLSALLGVAVLVGSVAVGWRRLRGWRVGLFVLTFAGLAVAIALPGGLPHHAYPLVVLAAAGALAAITAAAAELRRRSSALGGGYLAAIALIAVLQVAQANNTYGGVLYAGPQTPFLKASAELFYGSTLAPVRNADNPLFVFEDCLGGLHNPLRYYARASDGEEVLVPKFDFAQFRARFIQTARQGRESYVALCTGAGGPWYVLERYDRRSRRLVGA
jgi:hypothetical protein